MMGMTRIKNKRGQAAAEMAILGALIITAFSYIMNFGQTLGAAQQNKMETFRRALQKAYIRNASVNYTLKRNERMASVNSGFFQGQAIAPQSSSSVTWQKGKAGDMKSVNQGSFAFWQIDDTEVKGENELGPEYGLPLRLQDSYDAQGGKSDWQVYVPASLYKVNETRTEKYSLNSDKKESHSGINYTKTATMDDSAAGTLYLHYNDAIDETPADDHVPEPVWASPQEISYSTATSYSYDKNWGVSH